VLRDDSEQQLIPSAKFGTHRPSQMSPQANPQAFPIKRKRLFATESQK